MSFSAELNSEERCLERHMENIEEIFHRDRISWRLDDRFHSFRCIDIEIDLGQEILQAKSLSTIE